MPCSGDPSTVLPNITALYFESAAFPEATPRRFVELELTPTGNAHADVYTNSFGGRVPEIDHNIISNDVTVQVLSDMP